MINHQKFLAQYQLSDRCDSSSAIAWGVTEQYRFASPAETA